MNLSRFAAAAVALALGASQASADPVVSSQWYTFSFGGPGSVAGPAAFPAPGSVSPGSAPWTFTAVGPITVTVLDGFLNGDQFSLFDGAALVGTTSAPGGGPGCSSDIAACLADARMSRGVFALGAGAYSFTIVADVSPFGGGDAFFRIDPALATIPEPSTYALLATGLLAVGALARRRAHG